MIAWCKVLRAVFAAKGSSIQPGAPVPAPPAGCEPTGWGRPAAQGRPDAVLEGLRPSSDPGTP
eukprot:2760961-Lingulodinium_polyedra.AAC.1